MYDLAMDNHRWGKKYLSPVTRVPQKRPQDAKGQWHACSWWDTWAASGVQMRTHCLSRDCGPKIKERGVKQPMAQACRMSKPLATSALWLFQHGLLFKSFWGGLYLRGTKLRGGEWASAVKSGGTILPTHTASPSTCLKCFCSCWQVNDGLPQNQVNFSPKACFCLKKNILLFILVLLYML